jgi:hypothetical protein
VAKKKTASPAWRKRFLGVLGRTGNAKLAALEAGVDKGSAYYHRNRDARFAGQWDAAKAKGKAAAAAGKKTRPGKVSVELVLQDRKDGPKYVRAAEGRWCQAVEDAFFAALERTGCLRWAAAAAGVSTNTIHYRRRRYPDFAARCTAAEARAKERIPAILTAATIASFDPEIDGAGLPLVNVDQAIAIARLKCGEGAGRRRSRHARPEPTIEEVRDEVLRRIAAIRRHREKGEGDGDTPPP